MSARVLLVAAAALMTIAAGVAILDFKKDPELPKRLEIPRPPPGLAPVGWSAETFAYYNLEFLDDGYPARRTEEAWFRTRSMERTSYQIT